MRRQLPLLVFALLMSPTLALAHDWTSWRGPEQNGVSREVNLPAKWSADPKDPNNNLIWKAPYGCRSTPIVMDGRVYINNQVGEKINEQERVMCLDANTGKVLWEKRFNVFHTDIVSVRLGWGTLTADPETQHIYWHGTQGLFVCFDKNGKILWKRSLTEEYGRISGYGGRVTSPTLDEDLVIIGMLSFGWGEQAKGANRYLAMKKDTGDVVWWYESPHKPYDTYYSNPVIAVINGQRLLITGGGDGYLHAMKVRTGEPVWSVPLTKGGVNPSPVVDGNLVYINHGSENFGTTEKGGVFCFDASQIVDGKPKLVWKEYGIEANYSSPVLHDGKIFVCSDIARMYCLDAKTGKQLWRRPLAYGRNAKGSPVWADGKIYVAPVNAAFCIVEPGKTKGKVIHEHFFPSPDGISDVEVNGTPAIANGRVYLSTRDETYCIGLQPHEGKAGDIPAAVTEPKSDGEVAGVRVFPADVAVNPGAKVEFSVVAFDGNGRVLSAEKVTGKWSLPVPPTPPLPPKLSAPAPLKGTISESGVLTVDASTAQQTGIVEFKSASGMSAVARVRVEIAAPYTEDFEGLAKGYAPASWVNTQGKFFSTTLKDGNKVLMGNTKVGSPLVARAIAYISSPWTTNCTIEADMMGQNKGVDLPDMGLVNNRYRLVLWGNKQVLRIDAWDAMPRVAVGMPFKVEPDTWYRMKFKVQIVGNKAELYGKAWTKDSKEPEEWNIRYTDPNPNYNGSAGVYRYATGILADEPGTPVYFDNVRISPNGKE